jgi:hypothetical protein
MKKKQIDTQALANDLQQTGFFRRPASQPEWARYRTRARRRERRYSFELYEDRIERIKCEIVREAIDRYLYLAELDRSGE